MSARDDLARVTDEAREQVRDARAAVAASRETRGGGPAKNARQAEQQLHALRAAVAADVRSLRGRAAGADRTTRAKARTAALTGAGALSAVVGAGLATRRAVSGRVQRRTMQRQASALALALAEQATQAAAGSAGDRSSTRTRRGGRGGLVAVLAVGAAVGAAALVRQRRYAPVDPDDLWLPERTAGPA